MSDRCVPARRLSVHRTAIACALTLLAAITAATLPAPAASAAPLPVVYSAAAALPFVGQVDADPPGANDFACRPSASHPNPVVLVHGLGATAGENWATMSPLLKNNGYCVFALTYGVTNPPIGGTRRMEDSSAELQAYVDRVLAATGADKVDLVGHSEGTVMPQYYLKYRGGAAKVATFVALTPLYDGTTAYGLSTLQNALRAFLGIDVAGSLVGPACGSCGEFLRGSDFLRRIGEAGPIATPGVQYTTIMTRYDELVVPYTSGRLAGPNARNIVLQDVCPLDFAEHVSVAFDSNVGQLILNALDPAHAAPVRCRVHLPLIGG